MAHYAKINNSNEVLTVVKVDNSKVTDENGVEQESLGQQHLETHNNWPANMWIKTSYNTRDAIHYTESRNNDVSTFTESADQSKAFRGNYAGVGYIWDADNQIFWPPQPYPSWTKDISTATWQPPVAQPTDFTDEQIAQVNAGTHIYEYRWNEDNQV